MKAEKILAVALVAGLVVWAINKTAGGGWALWFWVLSL